MTSPSPQSPPRPSAKEFCKRYLDGLILAIVTMTCSNRIVNPLAGLISMRVMAIAHRLRDITERLEAGTFKPRRKPAPRKTPAEGRPWKPARLPTRRGWLAELLGPSEAPGYRGWLLMTLQQSEVIAAIEAAPTAMGREFRSLCWMLKVDPPEILVKTRPRRVRPSRAKPAPAPAPAPPPEPAEAAAETPAISWQKPRGSISNRLYRNYRPPGSPPKRKTAR